MVRENEWAEIMAVNMAEIKADSAVKATTWQSENCIDLDRASLESPRCGDDVAPSS
jgi:hypothetical protein